MPGMTIHRRHFIVLSLAKIAALCALPFQKISAALVNRTADSPGLHWLAEGDPLKEQWPHAIATYRGWMLHCTGWKTNAATIDSFLQWYAIKAEYFQQLAAWHRYWDGDGHDKRFRMYYDLAYYVSFPGGQGTLQRGWPADVVHRDDQKEFWPFELTAERLEKIRMEQLQRLLTYLDSVDKEAQAA